MLRRGLLDNGYGELAITSAHTVAIDSLPPIHKDPFDRILVTQATVEGITLLTADALVAQYPGPVRQRTCRFDGVFRSSLESMGNCTPVFYAGETWHGEMVTGVEW